MEIATRGGRPLSAALRAVVTDPQQRFSSRQLWLATHIVVLGLSILALPAAAQVQDAAALAQRASIVVRGKVARVNASDEPLVAPGSRTAVVTVEQMFAGNEIAGDQTGHLVTVILSRPNAVRRGEEALFFGNPRFVGKTVTIADEGEIPPQPPFLPNVERGVQARRDALVLDRLASASLVFHGSVVSVQPLAPAAEEREKRTEPASEHDPEWQMATVKVATAMRGDQAGQTVSVVFAGSRDITWFNSPKLKAGQEAVFIAHRPSKEELTMNRSAALAQLAEKQPVYLVTEPSDVLTAQDEVRVRTLLANVKETK